MYVIFLSHVSIILRSQPSWTSWGLCFISFPHPSLHLQLFPLCRILIRSVFRHVHLKKKVALHWYHFHSTFPLLLCTVKLLSCFKFVFSLCLMYYWTHPSLFFVPISPWSFLPRSLMGSTLPYQRAFHDAFAWYLGTIITSYCSPLEPFSCGFWETICLWFSFFLPSFSFKKRRFTSSSSKYGGILSWGSLRNGLRQVFMQEFC